MESKQQVFDENFVPEDISKKLYESGFINNLTNDETMPLWQQAQKWFRDKNIHIQIYRGFNLYSFDIVYPGDIYPRGFIYSEYNESLYHALLKVFELFEIKTK
jgi:hypothetical protein